MMHTPEVHVMRAPSTFQGEGRARAKPSSDQNSAEVPRCPRKKEGPAASSGGGQAEKDRGGGGAHDPAEVQDAQVSQCEDNHVAAYYHTRLKAESWHALKRRARVERGTRGANGNRSFAPCF